MQQHAQESETELWKRGATKNRKEKEEEEEEGEEEKKNDM